jgi:hypothetical protein
VRVGSVVPLRITERHGMASVVGGRHVVPGVVGENLLRATARIDAAHIPWELLASPLPPTATGNVFDPYCVTAQTPAAGTVITIAASVVTLSVALRARPCPSG